MPVLRILLNDHDDAAGTNGGDAFIELTVTRKNRDPLTTFRIDFANDDAPERLTITNTHDDMSPAYFPTHLALACAAWTHVVNVFSEQDHEFYSMTFGENRELRWDV